MRKNQETGIKKLTVKKVRSCRGHEGDAWSCDLYADGVKVAYAGDSGMGGEMNLDPPSGKGDGFAAVMWRLARFAMQTEVVAEANREWRENYPDLTDLYEEPTEGHFNIAAISLVVEELVFRTETAKKLNTKTIFRDAEGAEWSVKAKYSEEVRERLEKREGAVWFANTDPRYQKPISITLN